MSFPYPFSPSFLHESSGAAMPTLDAKKISILTSLLYEKGHELFSKTAAQKTLALTVNEICQALIHAYAVTFEARISGHRFKPVFQILKDRELSVCFSLKGSTVTSLIEGQDLSCCDLDTGLEFNQIPIPPAFISNEEKIREFFSSLEGRSYLKDFYFEVAFEATKNLLRLDNEKIIQRNLILGALGHKAIPLKSEPEIELLKDKFFNNLLLFAGSGTFLITFGAVDFAIKVPYMNALSSTHKADSLEIKIPINPLTCHAIPAASWLHSSYSMEESLSLLASKKVSIFQPQLIQFNGFERIMYAVTQGWSVIEKENLFVLLIDLFKRTTLEKPFTEIPLERLYFLMTKKMTNAGASESFCLRMFLNAYSCALTYAFEGSEEALTLADIFHEAFLNPEYLKMFPAHVQGFSSRGDLNHVLLIERLKLLISSKATSTLLFETHLSEPTTVVGYGSKIQGCLNFKTMSVSEVLLHFDNLIKFVPEEKITAILDEELSCLSGFELSLKEKILILLVKNYASCKSVQADIALDLAEHYKAFIHCISLEPSLLSFENIREVLSWLIDINSPLIGYKDLQKVFLKKMIFIEQSAPIVPLFCKLLQDFAEPGMYDDIQQSYLRKNTPVIFEALLEFILNLNDEALSPLIEFKIIENMHKASSKLVDLKVFMHPKVQKILSSKEAIEMIDQAFWKDCFNRLLELHPQEAFFDTYYNIAGSSHEIFEGTILNLNQSMRFRCFIRLLKDLKLEHACIFILHNGLNPYILNRLLSEESSLFKNKAFKGALGAISESQFTYIIEQLLSINHPYTEEALMSLWENIEVFNRSFSLLSTFFSWSKERIENKEFYFHLTKMLNSSKADESFALLALKVSKPLMFTHKTIQSVYKAIIDKFSNAFIALEESTHDEEVLKDLQEAKKKTVCLLNLGLSFSGRWGLDCEALRWESKSVEEAIEDYIKKPTEAMLFVCMKCLKNRTTLIEESTLIKLKDAFKKHEVYLLVLAKQIGAYCTELIKDKYAKEIFSLLTDEALKKEFFYNYLQSSATLKHLITFLQSIDLSSISQEQSCHLLDGVFSKASDEIKVSVLHRFKDTSSLRIGHPDVLFEFFKKIGSLSAKKNALLDYFVTHFLKLNHDQQNQLLHAPLLVEGTDPLSLINKAQSCVKSLDLLSMILAKRQEAGFGLELAPLLEVMMPLSEGILSNRFVFELKHQGICLKFIDRVLGLIKDVRGRLDLAIYDMLLKGMTHIPLSDLIRDQMFLDLPSMPPEFILAYLNKKRDLKHFTKADGEKITRILRHILDDLDPQVVFEYFKEFDGIEGFSLNHKKDLLPYIIAKAIVDKKVGFLFYLFGSKQALGFKIDIEPSIDLSFLKESSKASRKMLHDAILVRLEEADDLSKINLEVISPLKYVIDACGLEPFITLKSEVKNKFMALILDNITRAQTLEFYDNEVINPVKNLLTYFEPCAEFNDLLKAIFQKFLKTGAGALMDCKPTLEGFMQFATRFMHFKSIKFLNSTKPLIDLSNSAIKDEALDIFYEKVITLEPLINLIEVMKCVKLSASDLVLPLMRKIAVSKPELILVFATTASEEDLLILCKTLTGCSHEFYQRLTNLLLARVYNESMSSVSFFAKETLICNRDLSSIIINALKVSDTIDIPSDLLSSPLDVFAIMLPHYYDYAKDMTQIMTLLELRRNLEGLSHFTYCSRLKDMGSTLHTTYIHNMPEEIKDAFFLELEAGRLVFKKSILNYASSLMAKETLLAKMFLDEFAKHKPDSIIDEFRALEFNQFFKGLITIYDLWVVPGLHKELYPVVFEEVINKLEMVIAENTAKGDLSPDTLKALYETINCSCLCYNSTLSETGYPMSERMIPVFLRSLIVLLEPKNILKEHLGLASALSTVLRSIKPIQVDDMMQAAHVEALDTLLKSLLRFFSLDLRDYIKKGTLNKIEYEAMMLSLTNWHEITRLNYLIVIADNWMPKLLERKIDLFVPFMTLTRFINTSATAESFKKRYYAQLASLSFGYLEAFLKDYVPVKPHAVIKDILSLFDSKKVSREKKEVNALTGLYLLPNRDLQDYLYHLCHKINLEAEA